MFEVDGIASIFYGSDFITITKNLDANWAHVKPDVFSLITEALSSETYFVKPVKEEGALTGGGNGEELDAPPQQGKDSEVVGMIKELLETRIRPAIQEDGGDIEFRGFENGKVMLRLQGACRTCDSSTITLKNGIESMLMHYVSKDCSLSFKIASSY